MNTEPTLGNFDGRAVANFILDFCDFKGRPLSNLALQKIIYFCHVWSLIEFGRPLIKQQFEAWQFGPVLQYLYREFREFDRRPINIRATRLNPKNGEREVVPYSIDSPLVELLERTVDFYSRMSAGHLVELSHVMGGPWDEAWNHKGTINPGMKIDNDAIRRYYSKVKSPFTIH